MLKDVLNNLHAKIVGKEEDLEKIQAVYTYSKQVTQNSLFVAINDLYIDEAIHNGAIVILTNHPIQHQITYILVDDVVNFVKRYAVIVRKKFAKPVIAVLGSCGKTTIKSHLTQILPGKLLYTRRSYNIVFSICIEMLLLNDSYDFCILEIGTAAMGEVDEIARVVMPDYCIYGAIGLEHIESFKTLENIEKEESSVFRYVKKFAIGPECLKKYFNNDQYIIFEGSNEEKCKYLCEKIKVKPNNIPIYIPNHRGNTIYIHNKTIYDYSFNCNIESFKYMISTINRRRMNCDLILGNLLELGQERDNIISQIESILQDNNYIKNVYTYNIELQINKCKEFDFNVEFNDIIYIQGSRGNHLINIVCAFLNNRYDQKRYKFI